MEEIKKQFKTVDAMLSIRLGYGFKSKKNPTTSDMIADYNSSTRYNRRAKSKNWLHYIHGDEHGAILGAWDFLSHYADHEELAKLIVNHRKGKFLQEVNAGQIRANVPSPEERALATKYHCQLSRRKYQAMCRLRKVHGTHTASSLVPVSNKKVDELAKSIDIGGVQCFSGLSGVMRKMSPFVFDIMNQSLVWFQGRKDHFVIEFSDDSAPESRESTMVIGSIAL